MRKTKKNSQIADAAISAVNVNVASATAKQTSMYNTECMQLRISLADEAALDAKLLSEKLANNVDYDGDRSKGVSLAYKYEQADVAMGGRGSAGWSASERAELLSTGKVRHCEGHHINSVAEHPNQQTDPCNIRFYRSHKEHMYEGHEGDFRNPSSGELIDKDEMLKSTNAKRVIENEVKGVGISLALGAATGMGSSIYHTCSAEGFSVGSIKKGVKRSVKPILISCTVSVASYAVTRFFEIIFK